MNTNRHPAGTSLGGRWAPGSAAEIDDDPAIESVDSELEDSMAAARSVLDGQDTGRDLKPAIEKMHADEDYTSADKLTLYAGMRDLEHKELVRGLQADKRIEVTPNRRPVSEVTDDQSRPLAAGHVESTSDSTTFGLAQNPDGSYRVRVFHEDDVRAEVTTGDRTHTDFVRVNTLLTDRVERTGDAEADARAVRDSISRLTDHEEAGASRIADEGFDYVADGYEEGVLDREFSYDEQAPSTLGTEVEILEEEKNDDR